MCKQKQVSLRNLDETSPEKKAFFESALREMEELAEEAGDWQIHLPYEALVCYRKDSAVREQHADHYNNCSFCQKAMDALNPYDK
jgi:hypothetical protein